MRAILTASSQASVPELVKKTEVVAKIMAARTAMISPKCGGIRWPASPRAARWCASSPRSPAGADSVTASELADNAEIAPQAIGEGKPLKEYVEAFERMLIDNTMRRHKGSIVAVMDELCLPRRTLNEKMAKYALQRSDYL